MQHDYYLQPRTGKQCRERYSGSYGRWYNHLDPSINKAEWTEDEQNIIFQAHRQHGNKWKEIARSLEGRTDNSVKNHFYSTLRRSLRRINKFLGSKNSTSQMRDIKPSVLSRILDFTMDKDPELQSLTESYRDLPSLIFEFSNFKPVKDNIVNRSDLMTSEERQRFELIINKIIEFNTVYDVQKKARSKSRKKAQHKTGRKKPKKMYVAGQNHIQDTVEPISSEATNLIKLELDHGLVHRDKSNHGDTEMEEVMHCHSDGELSDHNMIMEMREPSLKSEDLNDELVVVGTPMKINVQLVDEGQGGSGGALEEDNQEEILEINYIG